MPCGKLVGEEAYSIVADYLGTPTHAFNSNGEKVWERELDFYGAVRKETGLKGLVPQLYQGQMLDEETGLAYNRFRYYDNDAGSYISQDPIGIAVNKNLYAYTTDTNLRIDVLGLAPWEIGKFGEWFNKVSVQDILNNKDAVESALRGARGQHEYFPVSMAGKAKELGFTYEELSGLSSPTEKIQFENVLDNNGNVISAGRHPSPEVGDKPRIYNSRASRYFHAKLMEDLNLAKTKSEALDTIKKHHDAHMRHH